MEPGHLMGTAARLSTSLEALAALAAHLRVESEGLDGGSARPRAAGGDRGGAARARTRTRAGPRRPPSSAWPGRCSRNPPSSSPIPRARRDGSTPIRRSCRAPARCRRRSRVRSPLRPRPISTASARVSASRARRSSTSAPGTAWLAIALAQAYPQLRVDRHRRLRAGTRARAGQRRRERTRRADRHPRPGRHATGRGRGLRRRLAAAAVPAARDRARRRCVRRGARCGPAAGCSPAPTPVRPIRSRSC